MGHALLSALSVLRKLLPLAIEITGNNGKCYNRGHSACACMVAHAWHAAVHGKHILLVSMVWCGVQPLLTLLATQARDLLMSGDPPLAPDVAAGPADGSAQDSNAGAQEGEERKASMVKTRGLSLLLESAMHAVPQLLLEQSIYK